MSTVEFVRDELKNLEATLEDLKDARELLDSLRKAGKNVTKELLDNARVQDENMKLQNGLVDALANMKKRREEKK